MTKNTIEAIRKIARQNLTRNALNYYESGADYEQTLSENCVAYNRLKIRPRGLLGTDCRESKQPIDLSTHVFGEKLSIPVCIAPTAMQRMAHDDGEIGTARGAASLGTCMAVSGLSTTSYEELYGNVPNCTYLMQLYIYKNRSITKELIERAERCGYKEILLTVDTPILGQRIADVKEKFKLPSNLNLANYSSIKELLSVSSESTSGLMEYVGKNIDSELSWSDITWIRSITKLPIVLKGILTREDAAQCLKHDIQGIIVSNHGARQLDGVPATIEALPEVVRAVQGKIPVFVDGGVRKGSDVFKALALGAKAVFVGRPILYGLAYNGEKGVKEVLQILVDELRDVMKLTGCNSIKDINPNLLCHESAYGLRTSSTQNWNWKPSSINPVCLEDIKESAREKNVQINDGEEILNRDAFLRLRLRPRRLQGILEPNSSLEIFNRHCDIPVVLNITDGDLTMQKEAVQVAQKTSTFAEVSKIPDNDFGFFYRINLNDDKESLSKLLQRLSTAHCKSIIFNIGDVTSWEDVDWIVKTSLIPVVVKGVMSIEQAIKCLQSNVQGIVVSNSGGNIDDLAPIDMLPEIVEVITYKIPVFVEGGIRKGTDIFKALAMGANAVFIDKPVHWGYAHDQTEGVLKVLDILKNEFERAMFLAGTSYVKEITSSQVVHESYYWNNERSISKL